MLNFKTISIVSCIALLGLIICNSSWIFMVLVVVIWFVITGLGSGLIGWNYHLKSVLSNAKTSKKAVAITFDDGPNSQFTPQVLALLNRFNAKATFFCIGKHAENHPDILKQIIGDGHTVGNHTYSHSNNFGFFSTQKVISELKKTNTIIENFTGLKMNLYRPAFGVTNPNISKAVKVLGLTSVGWNVRSLDTTSRNSGTVLNRITKHIKAGDIILLHDTSEKTLIVLEQLLLFLQQKNLASVTIDALCDLKPYE
ncbi:polysaccharide deacetylase [Tamlana nanhaiensis]|uniref:Polysaccharide deacetylase n=1 Tax=Neotamlana nanhaiensis TaxID=1382798 RepID=A0A0D7VZ97_9FLAO|nr:polysaccharide deacetylase family protein [Tamlana nanhaiensis]KJD32119.1 polysaccharide deacetylase [Tamlana nanhaiensis]KJD32281.1 polysaccharide deacetylase [Tamlana nanhaiensis]